ncbi:RagB/SusD family nutrient uptake outer membrane protein [Flavobacterium antarcticum]|uniref:RagB/SusD family nutrient uptake outer membrane protein n=1 Tax=Flavobacterium antarcticum TaxID=271155 RepID=UPI0003B304C1|nr:RagB/SusD family nutrient uptake outer membrane protein [Flavobacterium antarcticum]
MKNKIYILKIALTLMLVTSVVSCSIDDVKPLNQLTTENAIRDEQSAQAVLNGIYGGWRAIELNAFPLHLGALGNEGFFSGTITGSTGFNANQVKPENLYLGFLYNAHYKIINGSNFLIEELEKGKAVGISDERKTELIMQAKFARAMANFNLLRYFGQFYDQNSSYGIVLKTTFSTDVVFAQRNSVQEVYASIVADLEDASANGPSMVAHYFAGKVASTALLARVKLYMNDYEGAAAAAQEVILNAEGYELETNYGSIFSNTYNSSEAIFAIYHTQTPEGGSGMYQINRTKYSETLRTLADAQIDGAGSLTESGSGYDPRFSYAYATSTKGTNLNGKYPVNTFQANSENNTLFYIRLGEIYLIHAEAEARKAGGNLDDALTSLNAIRERAGVEAYELSDKTTLLTQIREEKLLELFFENGETWFDLIRYHKLGDVSAFAEKASLTSETQFILPMPLNVLSANNLLIQNPGY